MYRRRIACSSASVAGGPLRCPSRPFASRTLGGGRNALATSSLARRHLGPSRRALCTVPPSSSSAGEQQSSSAPRQDEPAYASNEDKGIKQSLKTLIFLSIAAGAGYLAWNMKVRKDEARGRADSASSAAQKTLVANAPTSLNPKEFVPFKLRERREMSHDTRLFRFDLPSAKHKLGLPVASCIVTRAPSDDPNKPTIRPYTPISSDNELGYFDLLIKVYPQGVMSKHIDSLRPGDTLEVKGPISKIPYTPNMKKKIGMLAGGTGITPMYQVIKEILRNPDDATEVSLMFCNKTTDDILIKKELDDLAKKHANFRVFYCVDTPPPKSAGWTGGVGFVTPEIVRQNMPPPSEGEDVLVMVCGPPGFYKHLSGEKTPDYKQGPLTGLLKDLGFTENQVFKF